MMLVFQGPLAVFSGSQGLYPQDIVHVAWFGPLLVMALSSAVLALWFKWKRIVFKSTGYQLGIMALMLSGGAFHTLWALGLFSDNPAGSMSILVIQSILTGTGASFFRIELDRIFGYVGANQTLFITFSSALIMTVAIVVLAALPLIGRLLFQVVLPALTFVCFRKSIRDIATPRYYAHGLENELFIPMKFLSTSFFQGIAFGAMSGSMLLLLPAASGLGVGTASRALAILVTGGVVLLFKFEYSKLLYKIGFPLMASGFVCFMLFPTAPQIGGSVALAGYLFLDVILWSLGAHLIKNAGLPATWIASFPGAALTAGTLLGAAISLYTVWQGDAVIVAFGGLMAVLLLAVALVMTSSRNVRYGWGTSRPCGNRDQRDWIEEVCRFLSSEHNLTRRESDVLAFLIQNKRKKEIGTALCVSLDTVKTHTKGIYRKLLIHSHDELVDIVEMAEIRLGRPEEAD
jgi:DNA-binding CsgD family transcriptional regulator